MIRFCDKEICCVTEEQLDRQQLLEYFINGHRSELVCVLDKEGKFKGSVTYLALLGRELADSINQNYLILDETIWEKGRQCLEGYPVQFGVETMVPVVDSERNLLCFAYQDNEANQELRMLDELVKHKSASGFADIYPQYDSVIIHDCNELAYYFILYLRNLEIPVHVSGALWEYFPTLQDVWKVTDNNTLDYRTLEIFGEGIWQKDERLELRYSVSPEFETIDKIYEANILEGIVTDAEGNIDEILKYLKEKPVALVAADIAALSVYALNAYDFLIANGVEICCFVTDTYEEQQIFGKSIMKRKNAIQKWKNIVFVQADSKFSAWGSGQTNIYHYLGYKRNKKFFLIQDYIELPDTGIKNVLQYWIKHMTGKMILAGDIHMCFAMKQALGINNDRIVFWDVLKRYNKEIPHIQGRDIKKEDLCLILLPGYYGCCAQEDAKLDYRKNLLDKYKLELKNYGIVNWLDYPFENVEWMRAEKLYEGYDKSILKPKRIILGAANYCSGNILFKGILSGHPDILVMRDCILGRNLYSFCVRLSMEPVSGIMQTLWELYEEIDRSGFPDKEKFDISLKTLLAEKERVTSQELFVLMHIAYAESLGIEVKNISDVTIYWEPHCVDRDEIEHYAEWLNEAKHEGYIVNIVRNSYIRAGSNVNIFDPHKPMDRFLTTVYYPVENKKEYLGWKRIVMKFEELKCDPKEKMKRFCGETGLEWSDKLLDVQATYKNISGFDLAPVYRTWEEYYSGFDRFRICLVKGPWQKKYGYPYVNSLKFSRRELQEMFVKKFRFEQNLVFESQELENVYMKWRQKWMNQILWDVRRKEMLGVF